MAESPHSQEETRQALAAHFFVSLLDESSLAVRAERDLWLRADPRNAVAYARIEAAWERAGDLRSLAPMPDHDDHPPSDHPGRAGTDQQ